MILLAALWETSADFPVRVLAVVGAFALGAFLSGWLLQFVGRFAFNQKIPPWPLWAVRGLSGLLCGWLVSLWLFGGGGGGIGGPGGFGLGAGGAGKEKDRQTSEKEKEKDDKKGTDTTLPPQGDSLRVEVLGDAPLKKIAKGTSFDASKRYRLVGEPGLRTIEEVQQIIRQGRERKPPLVRLEIIVYLDSPARDRPQVAALAEWVRDLGDPNKGRIRVDYSEPEMEAPVN